MGKIILLTLALILSGCHTTPEPEIIYKTVNVPIMEQCIIPPDLQRPVLPILTLDDSSNKDDIAKSYIISIEMLIEYSKEMEQALSVYKE